MRRIWGKLYTLFPLKFCQGKISSWPSEWKWRSLALTVDIWAQSGLNLRLTPFRDTIPSISLDYILLEENTVLLTWRWRCESPHQYAAISVCTASLKSPDYFIDFLEGQTPSQEPFPPFDFDPLKGAGWGLCFLTCRSMLFSWTATHNNFTSQSSLTTITGWTRQRFAARVAPRHWGRTYPSKRRSWGLTTYFSQCECTLQWQEKSGENTGP